MCSKNRAKRGSPRKQGCGAARRQKPRRGPDKLSETRQCGESAENTRKTGSRSRDRGDFPPKPTGFAAAAGALTSLSRARGRMRARTRVRAGTRGRDRPRSARLAQPLLDPR
ncbi:hypothetical protein U717_17850 [Rhodobacter capsulatus R121]|nr:hypothetical protein U714_17875 [Rhodobacter capsulatus DE442]ETD74372.1 hypothetical protein U717_17850 [Rhodobacter capsulatus R121]ETE52206.1 hypothetical protein U715_17840 [Rhodobacter capsulatus Y262]